MRPRHGLLLHEVVPLRAEEDVPPGEHVREALREVPAEARLGAVPPVRTIDVKNAESTGVSVFETLFEKPKAGVTAF